MLTKTASTCSRKRHVHNEKSDSTNAETEHDCKKCGSVLIRYVDQGSNDPRRGILIFNYVENAVSTRNCVCTKATSSQTFEGRKTRTNSRLSNPEFYLDQVSFWRQWRRKIRKHYLRRGFSILKLGEGAKEKLGNNMEWMIQRQITRIPWFFRNITEIPRF